MGLDRFLAFALLLITPWLVLEVVSRFLVAQRRRWRRPQRDGEASYSFTKRTWSMTWETTGLNALPRRLLRLVGSLPQGCDDQEDGNVGDQGALVRFYDLGVYFAALSLVGSFLVLGWGAMQLITDVVQLHGSSNSPTSALVKRDASLIDVSLGKDKEAAAKWNPAIVPLIPGVTVPLMHVVPLLLGLCLAQVIHEAGHALCAALHRLNPTSMGLVLFFPIIPGAFVALPEEYSDQSTGRYHHHDLEEEAEALTGAPTLMSNRERLRIVGAGVWHNAVSAALVLLFTWLGLSSLLVQSLWMPTDGIKVTSVDPSSPLALHLQPGTSSLITRLDDIDLAGAYNTPEDRLKQWNDYLLASPSAAPPQGWDADGTMGWCVPRSAWQASPTVCCDRLEANTNTPASSAPSPTSAPADSPALLSQRTTRDSSSSDSSLCFTVLTGNSTDGGDSNKQPGRCFDPSLLVRGPTKASTRPYERCLDACTPHPSTGVARVCVAAHPDEQLVRITVQDDSTTLDSGKSNNINMVDDIEHGGDGSSRLASVPTTRVVLFQGPRLAIYHALSVTVYTPRHAYLGLPPSLIRGAQLCVEYFLQLSWALALLNMLPLPSLDGDAFLGLALRELLLLLLLLRRRKRKRGTAAGSSAAAVAATAVPLMSRSSEAELRNGGAAKSTSRPVAMALRRPTNAHFASGTALDAEAGLTLQQDRGVLEIDHVEQQQQQQHQQLQQDDDDDDDDGGGGGGGGGKSRERLGFAYELEHEHDEADRSAFKIAQRARWLAMLLASLVLGGNVVLAFIHL